MSSISCLTGRNLSHICDAGTEESTGPGFTINAEDTEIVMDVYNGDAHCPQVALAMFTDAFVCHT